MDEVLLEAADAVLLVTSDSRYVIKRITQRKGYRKILGKLLVVMNRTIACYDGRKVLYGFDNASREIREAGLDCPVFFLSFDPDLKNECDTKSLLNYIRGGSYSKSRYIQQLAALLNEEVYASLSARLDEIFKNTDMYMSLYQLERKQAEEVLKLYASLKAKSIENRPAREYIINLYGKMLLNLYKNGMSEILELVDFTDILKNPVEIIFELLLSVYDISVLMDKYTPGFIVTREDVRMIAENETVPTVVVSKENSSRITVSGYDCTPTRHDLYYNERIFNLKMITLEEMRDTYHTINQIIYDFLCLNRRGRGSRFVIGSDMGVGKSTFLLAMMEKIRDNWGIGILDTQNELQAKQKYPWKNIMTLIQNPKRSISELFAIMLKTARDVLAVGEITMPYEVAELINAVLRLNAGVGATMHSLSPFEVVTNLENIVEVVYLEQDRYMEPLLEGNTREKLDNLLNTVQIALQKYLYRRS